MDKLTINTEIFKNPKKKTECDKIWIFLQARYV
ncbi:hypothetical protein MNBD_GAMMA09-2003 [hydrothermal vent metagenome]|uniref:Uncharacterized protein n=1 Tax=hydrothermal vent metagenome TaxID=652676 RepID=A0A3B0XZN3_9ZZZZ